MMGGSLSLRSRLIIVILTPLMAIAALVGTWSYSDAQRNAAARFDRSLMSTALAISRDIAVTGGDAVSPETRDMLTDTSGGQVFYHVYAPDGVFVTGYATPPVPPSRALREAEMAFYDAIYRGASVRALRVTQTTAIDGVRGPFTFTVWQATDVRDGFVRSRTQPVFLIIASMIGALAIVVWFGVAIGLAPLTYLEDAIARRSAGDLSPIRRQIPAEARGIVGQLNTLLHNLATALKQKDAFISDAAHQLRTPITGVLSLADAVEKAPSLQVAKTRARDLAEAAREAGRLTNSLLTLERMRAGRSYPAEAFNPVEILHSIVATFGTRATQAGVQITAKTDARIGHLHGDATMFAEAVKNLVDNALLHGGPQLSEIRLTAKGRGQFCVVTISDNGVGIQPVDFDRALGRFGQIGTRAGAGLGLPIAQATAENLGGTLELSAAAGWFTVTITLPRSQ